MKVAIVCKNKNGLESEVSEHFGKAPYLAIFDSETLELIEIIENKNHHFGGQLSPPKFIKINDIEELVVKTMGENALTSCNRFGIEVYLGAKDTVKETIKAYSEGELRVGKEGDEALHPSDPTLFFERHE